ncbi:hypothetical protein CERZMDRAFT_92096 [Cercospora zeae-maydis SCOH1-5]|uniref:C2H2-type domain-containing protein n=1 Tax=Cercospora zeae-maydis SCOH1-5 TaxID=717836 RepID=A0A6A6FVE1_9PEZI|nr:hypothetical protein CERZMDRAFT_92096 [Cercospora zeae-maydis SCOH1-5]
MSSTNDHVSETEAGLDSFDAMSPWSAHVATALSSFQSDMAYAADDTFGVTQSDMAVNEVQGLLGLGAECVDNIGTWTDGLQTSHRDQFEPDPAWFTQDFTVYASPGTLQHFPNQTASRAIEGAAVLLAPSIVLSPPVSSASHTPLPNKKVKHTRSIPRAPSRKRSSRPAIPCSVTACQKTFTRASDLDRHVRNVHGQSNEHYSCVSHRCLYRTRRKDKMQEHCQKVHAYARGAESFDTIAEDAGPFTPLSSSGSVSTHDSSSP